MFGPAIQRSQASAACPIQRVPKVFVGSSEITEHSPQGPEILKFLDQFTNGFAGEIWFTSGQQLQGYIRSKGKLEGVGVWNNRWMNFAGKGPIVFGEEHNEIRHQFIRALNITHYVVEGSFERSLSGVPAANIPPHAGDAASHQPYTGNGPGKALENYWVRSAQSMARFWVEFETDLSNVDRVRPMISKIERHRELAELLTTIAGTTPVDDRTGIEGEINAMLARAKRLAGVLEVPRTRRPAGRVWQAQSWT